MAVFHQPDAKIFLNVLDALKISLETMHSLLLFKEMLILISLLFEGNVILWYRSKSVHRRSSPNKRQV